MNGKIETPSQLLDALAEVEAAFGRHQDLQRRELRYLTDRVNSCLTVVREISARLLDLEGQRRAS